MKKRQEHKKGEKKNLPLLLIFASDELSRGLLLLLLCLAVK